MTRKYGGKSSDERRAERRERVLDAALELYGTKGYRATTITEVCTLAHVTTRHFYEEFDNAEQLIFELYNHLNELSTIAVIEAIVDAPLDPHSRIQAGLQAYLETCLLDVRKGKVVAIEVIGVSDQLEAQRRHNRHAFADLFASQAREMRPDAPWNPEGVWRVGLLLVGGIGEVIIDQIHSPAPIPIDQLVHEVASVWEAAATIGITTATDEPLEPLPEQAGATGD